MTEEEAINETDVSERPLERLHPLTLVLEIPTLLFKWVGPFVAIGLVLGFGEEGFGKAFGWAIAGIVIGAVQILGRYLFLRFGLRGDRLLIRTGLLARRQRTIPLAQVQNINLESGPAERLFRVTRIKIETAGGKETEASLAVVSEAVAERFREEILSRKGEEFDNAGPGDEEIVRDLTFRELILAGATENRVGVIVAALFGLYELTEDTGRDYSEDAVGYVEGLLGSGAGGAATVVVVLILVFVLAGWLVSIFLTALRYYRFSLWLSGDGLRRRHGLLTRFEALITLKRIQVVLQDANPLRRLLGYVTIRIQTAGSPASKDKAGSTVLYPLLPKREAGALTRLVFPSLDLDGLELRQVHPRAIRRGFIRFLLLALLATMVLTLWQGWLYALSLGPLVALAWFLAKRRYRALGYAWNDEFVFARAGLWTRRLWIIPRQRIQTIAVRQSPFQRRYRLASLVIDTAGAATWSAATIIDLAEADADTLFAELATSAATLAWAEAV